METTRTVARRLALKGVIEILQKGQVLKPNAVIKGPIRLRIAAKASKKS